MNTKKLKAAWDEAKAKAHKARWSKSTAKAARAKWDEARAKSDEARAKWDESGATADVVLRAALWDEARAKWNEFYLAKTAWLRAERKEKEAQTEAAKARSKAVTALYRAAAKAWEKEDEAKGWKGTLTVNDLRAVLEGMPGEAEVLLDIEVMGEAVPARFAWDAKVCPNGRLKPAGQDDEARAVVVRA